MITLFKRQQVQHACVLYQVSLLRVALSWCHDPYLAEDLSQECMAKAIKNCQQLKDPRKIKSWLMQILSNCWRDYLRRRHEHEDIDKLVISEPDNAHQDITQTRLAAQIQQAVSQLPLAQRQVVTLIDIYESTYQEVADILDVPIGTIMSRLSRARKTLALTLAAHHPAANVTPLHTKPTHKEGGEV